MTPPRDQLQRLRELLGDPHCRAGLRALGPTMPGMAAWGLVTGVAMAKSGLGLGLSVAFSLCVYAGTAQLAALPLVVAGAPLWLVLVAASCVNLRFVVFSAQLRAYFEGVSRPRRLLIGYLNGDIVQLLMLQRYPQADGSAAQRRYYLGLVSGNWVSWQIPSLTGIALASVFPDAWGVGFAGTLALLGIASGLLADRGIGLVMAASALATVALVWLPLHLNLAVAIVLAMLLGMGWDARPQRARDIG